MQGADELRGAGMSAAGIDAELMSLAGELRIEWARMRAFFVENPHPADDVSEAAMDRCSDVVHKIERIPARSIAGLQVKALAISYCLSDDVGSSDECVVGLEEGDTTDIRLTISIVRDLLAMTGEGA